MFACFREHGSGRGTEMYYALDPSGQISAVPLKGERAALYRLNKSTEFYLTENTMRAYLGVVLDLALLHRVASAW